MGQICLYLCPVDPKAKTPTDLASCQKAQRKEKSSYACKEKGAEWIIFCMYLNKLKVSVNEYVVAAVRNSYNML